LIEVFGSVEDPDAVES